MAPGYEDNPEPGFTRPITPECLLCHSDRPLPIPGSLNRYQSPAFAEEAISCDRCHGDPAAHLKRPVPGSIVNPAKLAPAQRDSVCERCHLAGAIRVLNPGKSLTDFHPGQTLESVFTTYVAASRDSGHAPIKVVSQSEQLARSRCSIASEGRMWCGTCHDPHDQPPDSSVASYFNARCLNCHKRAFPNDHPPRSSNCLPCHMPRREAQDGGHTAFTDHLIERYPRKDDGVLPPIDDLSAWRAPAPDFQTRNKALALNYAGLRYGSSKLLAQSYGMLIEVRKTFPNDPDVLMGMGTALMDREEPLNAAKLFDRALEIQPGDPSLEDNAGTAWLEAGDRQRAAQHFERALTLDPLLLPDIEALLKIYRDSGELAKQNSLMDRVREAMKTGPARSTPPRR
jgi:predicted CXXCH cytochrome family protein